MTDVFISYKREDMTRVAPIVEGLRRAQISVWWDVDITGGETWRQSISEHLTAARCVIVVWSTISVSPLGEFVHDEASRAKARGVLVPVLIDRVSEPIGFGEIQALNLENWHGNFRDRRFKILVSIVKAMVGKGPRPRPRVPGRRARLLATWISGLSIAAMALGIATNLVGLQKLLCRIPGVHTLCASWGLGAVPTKAEEILWAERAEGDCEGLRAYLARFPSGSFAEEAARRLQASVTVEKESWIPGEQHLPLTVRRTLDPMENEQAARADAILRATIDAKRACDGLKIGGLRVKSARVEPQKSWNCLRRGPGSVCGFDGQVTCLFEVRRVTRHQVCQ